MSEQQQTESQFLTLANLVQKLWFPVSLLFALHLLIVHVDTGYQINNALKDRALAEKAELDREISRLVAEDTKLTIRVTQLESHVDSLKAELIEVKLKQRQVRQVLNLKPE